MDLAEAAKGIPLGYCISSIDSSGVGEIESIFVDEACRGRGVGATLMEAALGWMDRVGVKGKRVVVVSGNEEVLAFYERFGFRAKNVEMIQMKR